MSYMYDEIFAQPKQIRLLQENIDHQLDAILEWFKEHPDAEITLAARGSSDNACNYFKYLAEVYLGIPVTLAAPSVVTLYGGKLRYRENDLIIGVSQSGEAQDVLAVMNQGKASGAKVVAFTNNGDSPMAKAADYHVEIMAGSELSIAATKTFTAELFALGKLVDRLAGGSLKNAFEMVPDIIEKTLAMEKTIEEASRTFFDVENLYVLGRGFLFSAAQESALKIQETTYVNAKAYAFSDFHHGPFAVLDPLSHVILFLESGKTFADGIEMIEKIRLTGASLLVLSDVTIDGLDAIKLPDNPESVSPFAFTVAMQLFAYHLAKVKGIDPDKPRNLRKITITK